MSLSQPRSVSLAGFPPLLTEVNAAMRCACELTSGALTPPCATHHPQAHTSWLAEHAPRVGAAHAVDDPLCAVSQFPTDAAMVAEFCDLRAALSSPAREDFDLEWVLRASTRWPGPCEFVLTVRDNWPSMILAQERDTVRQGLRRLLSSSEHLAEASSSRETQTPDGHATADDLRAEAETLAELAGRAHQVERMIHDHLAGGACCVTDVLKPSDPYATGPVRLSPHEPDDAAVGGVR